jgi:hypothetical protein
MDPVDPMDFVAGGVEIHGIHVRRSRRDNEEPAPSVQTAEPLRSEILTHADVRRQPAWEQAPSRRRVLAADSAA